MRRYSERGLGKLGIFLILLGVIVVIVIVAILGVSFFAYSKIKGAMGPSNAVPIAKELASFELGEDPQGIMSIDLGIIGLKGALISDVKVEKGETGKRSTVLGMGTIPWDKLSEGATKEEKAERARKMLTTQFESTLKVSGGAVTTEKIVICGGEQAVEFLSGEMEGAQKNGAAVGMATVMRDYGPFIVMAFSTAEDASTKVRKVLGSVQDCRNP